MAGNDRGEYRPRRARLDDPADDAEQDPTDQLPAEDEADVDTGSQPAVREEPPAHRPPDDAAEQPAPVHQPTTEERIAAARRAERLAELQQLRDSSGGTGLQKADRPDVGRRPNISEPVIRPAGRSRSGIVASVIAVVVVAALAVGYLLWSDHRATPAAQEPQPSATSAASTHLITEQTMFSPQLAKTVVNLPWQVTADQPAGGSDSPVPACLAGPQDDSPTPSETMVRTLSTSTNGPTALHLSEAYRTSELAAESFALVAKSLGGCNLKGSFIDAARVITGLGDQATAVLLENPAKDSYRAVVANRTGRLVNVIDIAQTKTAPDLDKASAALGKLTDQQCTAAIGICASDPQVSDGPPPVGGDEPGFLALADIPVPTSNTGTWGGLAPGSPADVVTSGCENVDFATLSADGRAARSYVLVDKPKGMPSTFGLDEITITMKSAKDAAHEAGVIANNIKKCSDRLPTAHVLEDAQVSGVGANDTKITGSVALVSQRITTKKSSKYRVGIAAVGDKLVYTFLPRTPDWDLTQDEWSTLTVRAAQRASQVR